MTDKRRYACAYACAHESRNAREIRLDAERNRELALIRRIPESRSACSLQDGRSMAASVMASGNRMPEDSRLQFGIKTTEDPTQSWHLMRRLVRVIVAGYGLRDLDRACGPFKGGYSSRRFRVSPPSTISTMPPPPHRYP